MPPSGELLSSIIQHHQGFVRAFYVPPSIVDQWAQLPEAPAQAEQLDFILYGGGPLPTTIGEKLSKITDVCQMYGSVETGQIQLLVPCKNEDDWSYMEWNPCEEVDMQPSIEGTHELVLHQQPKFRPHRSLNHNFPELREWRSGDLFVQHPNKTGLWRYHGRIDDLIVLANSHKIHPVALENSIQNQPLVSGVLMFGTGRVQPGLLIELTPNTAVTETMHNDIWQLVQRANQLVPQYGRITRSRLLWTSPDKPLPRAPKGSIVRRLALNLYEQEIDSLYARVAQLPNLDTRSLQSVTSWINVALSRVLPGGRFGPDDDIFSFGLDSLQVNDFTNLLRSALKHVVQDKERISNHLLYRNPSVGQLALAVQSLVTSSSAGQADGNSATQLSRLIDRYSNFEVPRTQRCAVLTGSTGYLGSHVLRCLRQAQRFDKIFVLTRRGTSNVFPSPTSDVLQQSDINTDCIERIEVEWTKINMGLTSEVYDSLIARVDTIIHMAWNVDFNLTLQSFERDHLQSLKYILNFSIASPRKPRVVFASSTAYAISWALKTRTEVIPEQILPNASDVTCNGYGLSKQVAEQLLNIANTVHKVPISILRMGQVASPGRQYLSHKRSFDWVHALVVTSKHLRLIPFAHLEIDWLPADVVARVFTDAATTDEPDAPPVLNLIHPRPVQWSSFLGALRNGIGNANEVPLSDWVDAMERCDDQDPAIFHKYPALRLKEFFRGLVALDQLDAQLPKFKIDNTFEFSEAFRVAQPLDLEMLVMNALKDGH